MSHYYLRFIERPTSMVTATMRSLFKNSTRYSNRSFTHFISTQFNKRNLDSNHCERRTRLAALPYLINILCAVGVTILVGFVFRPFPPYGPKMRTLSCGSTPIEARKNGCTYDVLGNIWVPTPCLDTENLAEFKRMAPWQAYDSAKAEQQLTEEEMSEYLIPDGYWTPVREHMIHCALMWRRLHKGFEQDARLLDKHVLSYHHTEHCSMTLMEHLDMPTAFLDEIRTRTEAGYSSCQVPA